MESQYKLGDRVIIDINNSAVPFGVNEIMKSLNGKEAVIMNIRYDEYDKDSSLYPHLKNPLPDGCRYRLDIDNKKWSWSNVMFKPVNGFVIVDENFE